MAKRRYSYVEFLSIPSPIGSLKINAAGYGDPSQASGGAALGNAGDENAWLFGKELFEQHILGTQTLIAPRINTGGLDISGDQTDNEGCEITQGILSVGPAANTVNGAGDFFLRVQAVIDDVSGCDPFFIGFRKCADYQANLTDYTDYAGIGIFGTVPSGLGKVMTSTRLASGTVSTVDSTEVTTNSTSFIFKVLVATSGAVTFQCNCEDGTTLAAPTITQSFSFTTTDVVMPFIYFLHSADVAEKVQLKAWEFGLQ